MFHISSDAEASKVVLSSAFGSSSALPAALPLVLEAALNRLPHPAVLDLLKCCEPELLVTCSMLPKAISMLLDADLKGEFF